MAVTIKDVAAKCGLSVSTVSKAFNEYADISRETRDRVQRVAREIGYFPNAVARALKTNRSYNLGVLFVDDNDSGLTHSFFAALLDAFKRESERRGYDITFINHNIGNTDMTYLEHCRYRNVDGVCLACIDFYAPEVVELMQSDIPCVTVDHIFNNRSCILSENVQGMEQLVSRAAELGHTRIAYLHGRPSSVTESRITGFYRALRDHGLTPNPDWVLEAAYDNPALVRQMTSALLAGAVRPTCILLPDDSTCLGALEAITAAGLRVPEDVSIAGYDGIKLTQLLHPRLTTIAQDTETMGQKAAFYLIDRIENPRTAGSEVVTVAGRLLEGETLGAAPKG